MLIWFSKPNQRSSSPLYQNLLSGGLTPYFFARWNQNPPFTFLGTGTIASFEDGYVTTQGHLCIRFIVNIKELQDIIPIRQAESNFLQPNRIDEGSSSFRLEKHLEDFMVTNWNRTPLSREYDNFGVMEMSLDSNTEQILGQLIFLGRKKMGRVFLSSNLNETVLEMLLLHRH